MLTSISRAAGVKTARSLAHIHTQSLISAEMQGQMDGAVSASALLTRAETPEISV